MKTRLSLLLAIPALLSGLTVENARAQRPKGNPQDEAALLKCAEAFLDAFHRGDAKALAAHWTPDGDYTLQTGKQLKGREAIEKVFAGLLAENKGLKLRIDIDSLKFVTPDVAVEDGTTAVIPPDGGPPSRARYTVVHVKKNGQWYLSSVRDAPFTSPTNHEHLSGLEWLIGDWAATEDKGETARVAYTWAESQNFIIATFTTSFKNIAIGGGTEWIGWDPLAKQIRSWTFETGGGFGEGTFSQDQGKWMVKSTLVLPDGKKLASTSMITRTGADTLTWQSRERTLDGQPLPEVKAITMKRVK